MKRFFDILFVILTIFIVSFIIFNSNLVLENYKFLLFGIEFNSKLIFFGILFFLAYLLISWILVRFVFVFNSSKENKLNKKIIELQEKINKDLELEKNKQIKELEEKFEGIIIKNNDNIKKEVLEKFEEISGELGKINAQIGYLKDKNNN